MEPLPVLWNLRGIRRHEALGLARREGPGSSRALPTVAGCRRWLLSPSITDRKGSQPMNRATLTAAYLDEVKRRGLHARELIGSQADADYLNIFYDGRYLSRPLFLGAEECAQLHGDMENLRSALISIPDRL